MLQGTQRAQPTCINVPLPPRLAPSSRVVLAVCQPTPTTQRETPWFDPGNNCGRTKRSQKIDITRSVSMFRCSDVPMFRCSAVMMFRRYAVPMFRCFDDSGVTMYIGHHHWSHDGKQRTVMNTHRVVGMYRRQLLHQRHLILREQREVEGYQDVRLY